MHKQMRLDMCHGHQCMICGLWDDCFYAAELCRLPAVIRQCFLCELATVERKITHADAQ